MDKKYHEKWFASIKAGDKYFVNAYGPNSKNIWEDSTMTTATPLYLTEKYNRLLDNFLGNKHGPFATGGIMNTAQAKGESADRKVQNPFHEFVKGSNGFNFLCP